MAMFGGDSNDDRPVHRDHHESVIDPALRSSSTSPPDKSRDSPLVNHHHPSSMSLRVEPFQMSSPFVSPALCSESRLFNLDSTFDRRRQSQSQQQLPQPLPQHAPDSHSPSPSASVDRSSNSTPHIRRSPPHSDSSSTNAIQHPSTAIYSSSQAAYPHDPAPIISSQRSYSSSRAPENITPHPAYIYTSHSPSFEHHHPSSRYDPQHQQQQHHHHHQHPQQHQPHHHHHHYPSAHRPYPPPGVPVPYAVPHLTPAEHAAMAHHQQHYERQNSYTMPGQPPVAIQHTDDAATKLTDGIRRRCFNCCTTDTSTWRRSNLSPGKVLCNKCGLFERTHSRPRPDQFPHKRGPLATSTLRGRTPPGLNAPPMSGGLTHQLPPIATSTSSYQYTHPSIAPLNSVGEYAHHPHGNGNGNGNGSSAGTTPGTSTTTLPGLQAWQQQQAGSGSGGIIGPGGSSSSSSSRSNDGGGGGGGGGDGDNNNNLRNGGESGGSGSGSVSASASVSGGSAHGTPQLGARRSTLVGDNSPRMSASNHSHHSSPRERDPRDLRDRERERERERDRDRDIRDREHGARHPFPPSPSMSKMDSSSSNPSSPPIGVTASATSGGSSGRD